MSSSRSWREADSQKRPAGLTCRCWLHCCFQLLFRSLATVVLPSLHCGQNEVPPAWCHVGRLELLESHDGERIEPEPLVGVRQVVRLDGLQVGGKHEHLHDRLCCPAVFFPNLRAHTWNLCATGRLKFTRMAAEATSALTSSLDELRGGGHVVTLADIPPKEGGLHEGRKDRAHYAQRSMVTDCGHASPMLLG